MKRRPNRGASLKDFLRKEARPYQNRVHDWMLACFGADISIDVRERCDRFAEEAIELTQALGYDRARWDTLLDYVFSRPVGVPEQEVGGVSVTFASLCTAAGVDQQAAAEKELSRIWTKVPEIRAKQASKRDLHGALPT